VPNEAVKAPAANPAASDGAGTEDTGVPWLRTWGRLYAFVLAWFIVCVALLLALTEVFR
jgi:hypothetical protein